MSFKPSILLGLTLFSASAFSFEGHPFLGGLAGVSVAKLGQSYPQISYTSGSAITDAYPLNNNHTSTGIVGLNGGYEFSGAAWKPAIAVGVGLYQTGQYDIRGQVIETAVGDAPSTLYSYKYSISSFRTMAELQFTWMLGKFAPFINVGVGPAWNQSGEYTETAASSTGYTALSPFQSRTNANLAFQAGFGVSCGFNFTDIQSDFKRERLSLGYRYVDLGQASLGTRGSAYPYQLNTGQLKTYEVTLNYTHLFG